MKRLLIVLALIAAAAATWWIVDTNKKPDVPPSLPREVAPQRWQITGASGEKTAIVLPTELANATNASTQDNATESNATEDNATALTPEDSIVTHTFVQDLSHYLVSIYHPAQTKRNPGAQPRFDLSLKSLNLRYGVDFPGLNVDPGDPLQSRQVFFAHVLKPTVLDFLYATYFPIFLDDLERALQTSPRVLTSGEKANISDEQRREMFNLLAAKIRTISATVAALARADDVQTLVGKYLADVEKVNAAHLAFWNLDADSSSPAARAETSAAIKNAIQTRELSRQRVVQAVIATANPQGLEAADLIFLAQWVYRRAQNNPALLPYVAQAGDLGVKMANTLEERARQPQPSLEGLNASQGNLHQEISGPDHQ